MRITSLVLLVIAIVATSCLDDFSDKQKSGNSGRIPSDFDWKTTQDVSASVSAPVVGGVAQAANVRIYSSPILYPENLIAKGVTTVVKPFSTSFTMPAGAKKLYVQTSLPDGTASVKMVSAAVQVNISGVEMPKAVDKFATRIAAKTATRVESSMPAYPKAVLKAEADFDPRAVIRTQGFGQLGASWCTYASPEYLIPAGTEIADGIDLNGTFSPYATPILYVAGKLTVPNLSIGQAQLVVLPGGEVTVGTLNAQDRLGTDKASVFVFEGGKLTTSSPNLSCKYVVNEGEFVVTDDLDFNNGVVFCNGATGKLSVDGELKVSNKVKFYNDGHILTEDLFMNSDGEFYNCENALLEVAEDCEFERNTTIYQRGVAHFRNMIGRGTIYVNCYTTVDDLEAQGATINMASGAGFDTRNAMFNQTTVSMGAGSILSVKEYNITKKGGKTHITYASQSGLPAVVRIEDKGYSAKGHETYFEGNIELVYDDKGTGSMDEELLSDGAVMRKTQTVTLAPTVCNGGKEYDPDPDPLPENDYELKEGGVYTYCFEDQWPWMGDYDMNDVVLETRIDRLMSKDGSLVKSITVNWSLVAAGAQYELACAMQMNDVLALEIASVTPTHKIGSGAFETDGLEPGNTNAVIPFFNHTKEVLSTSNTIKNDPRVEPQKHTTTITFVNPIVTSKVNESVMNIFITVNGREKEVHLSGYHPSALAVVGEGAFLPEDPYRFFIDQGPHMGNNYMMWGLMIPGAFRYPAEGKVNDIRGVYKFFSDWAASGGMQHKTWYKEEADENKLY